MMNITLEAPWETYYKKIKALFGSDPDIEIGDIYEPDNENLDYAFDMEIKNHEQFVALDRLFPHVKHFGNVAIGAFLFDEENKIDDSLDLYKTIFAGNPMVKDIKEIIDPAGVKHGYVRFWPEVVQFYDDDLTDFSGNWNGLAEDIAWEVFEDDTHGINFCTADKREDVVK